MSRGALAGSELRTPLTTVRLADGLHAHGSQVVPATCPNGRSVRDCRGQSRTDRQAYLLGSQQVAATAEHP